jgi:tetratricopeptide (TPR) repeat protein
MSACLARALRAACLCAAWLAIASAAPAQAPADLLATAEAAQQSYDRGMQLRSTDPMASRQAFEESARAWQQLVDAGASNGPLHFNLGNAQLQAGDVGRAIASYLRAERSMPGDPDLEQNLRQARSSVQHAFQRAGGALLVESVARWWHIIPLSVREAAAWVAWAVFWSTLAAMLLAPAVASSTPTRVTIRKLVLATSAVVWCLLGGSLIADEVLAAARPQAVLVEPEVQLRKGNGEGFEPAFAETLSPGVEVHILEERPGWWRIELPDGRSGWIKSSQAERVG